MIFPMELDEICHWGTNDFQMRGMTVPELHLLQQTITVPAVHEQSIIIYIHHQRRLTTAATLQMNQLVDLENYDNYTKSGDDKHADQ